MDYIARIRKFDRDTRKQVNRFIADNMPVGGDHLERDARRVFLLQILLGARQTQRENEKYRQTNGGKCPTQVMEPHYGVILGSNAGCPPEYVVGHNLAAETLALRQCGSKIRGADGKLTPLTKAFVALCGSKKGISWLAHVKDDTSKTFELAYDYYANECTDGEPCTELLQKAAKISPILIQDAIEDQALCKEVAKNVAYCEAKGISFERKLSDGTTEALTDQEKFRVAMAAQDAMWDDAAYGKEYPDAKLDWAPVVHSALTGEHYCYLRDEKKYVRVPSADDQKGMLAFLEQLPENLQLTAYSLAVGRMLFRNDWDARRTLNLPEGTLLNGTGVASCSDPRQTPYVYLGRPKDMVDVPPEERPQIFSFRVPGTLLIDKNGNLTREAERFLAHAKLQGIPVLITGHTACGAMKQTDKHLSGKSDEVLPAFLEYGDELEGVYETVFSKSKTGDTNEIIAHYRNETGIPVESIADCLSVQTWQTSLDAVNKVFPDALGAFHGTSTETVYITNIHGGARCVEVPFIAGLDPKTQQGLDSEKQQPTVPPTPEELIRSRTFSVPSWRTGSPTLV